MKKFSLLLFLFSLSFATLVNSCKQEASCTDGKQNQGETGIDCGDAAGKCPPCENAVSCSNGVQDGGELGVDCGGPCPNACQTNPYLYRWYKMAPKLVSIAEARARHVVLALVLLLVP
ncbi:MAG: hypothetical protein IPN94_19490 [Sphingobacteriales bacterium]|nr:hypothetical protein [Sphingobacteriales bacterium]